MSVITNNCLGLKLNVNVPATVEEFDSLAKKSGAALDSAISNTLYRSWNNQFRTKFSEHLEKVTGIKRASEVVLAKDGTPKKDSEGNEVERYTETEAVYVDRVLSQLVHDGKAASVEAALATFAGEAQSIADSITFDPSEREAAPTGPKKPSKKWVEVATELEKRGRLAEVAAKLAEAVGHPVEATINDVALAIAEKTKIEAEKATASLLA